MNWAAIKRGLDDELLKIAEFSLAGLSPENLAAYPRPEPMPGEGFSKAQSILQKAEQYAGIGSEKTAARVSGAYSPDQLPFFRRIKKKSDDPPPTKVDKGLSWAGHVLAGTGAAKFVGDNVETHLSGYAHRNPGKLKFMELEHNVGRLPPSVKSAILAAGTVAGIAHKVRKEHRKKKWQEGKLHTAAAFQFPASGKASKGFLGKAGPGIKTLAVKI